MDRTKEIVKVSYRGIAVNALLVIFKAIVGFAAGSISIILDAVNNLSDVLSSVITIVGTKLAGRGPDREHPYGHGRIEYITSLVIALIVLIAGVTSLREAAGKIMKPSAPEFTVVSVIIIAAGVLVKFFLGRYFSAMGKKLDSGSLSASGKDASFDAVISTATLVSAVIMMTVGLNIEGWLGAVISLFIIRAGIEIITETLDNIIGVRTDKELSTGIKNKINSFPQVHGSHDLILHSYGPSETLGSVHIEVDDTLTAAEIDELSRCITAEVYRDFSVYLTIGIYATNTSDELSSRMRQRLTELVKSDDMIIEMHGFYVDREKSAVTFDVIYSYDEKDPKGAVERLKAQLEKDFPEYSFFPNLDRDFSD